MPELAICFDEVNTRRENNIVQLHPESVKKDRMPNDKPRSALDSRQKEKVDMSEIKTITAYHDNPKCGEIWMCNLTKKDGSTQTGYRPVYVLSNNRNNTFSPTLNVIPLTSKMSKRRLPIHVYLWDYEYYGLRKPSTLLVEQITTVSVSNLDTCIGEIRDKETMKKIYQALEIQFPIVAMFSDYK